MKLSKKLLSGTVTLATVAAPIATVVSCGSTDDLSKTIVVLAPVSKTAEGVVTRPMKKVYDQAIKNWKTEHPKDASNYKVVIKELDFEQYQKIATVGTTGKTMPDIWFFPTDKMYLLHDKYNAIAPISEYASKEVQHELGLTDDKAITFEKSGDKNYGFRFKNESVMMWGNANAIDDIFPKANEFLKGISNMQVPTGPQSQLTVGTKKFLLKPQVDLAKVKPSELIQSIQGVNLTKNSSKDEFNEAKEKVAKFFAEAMDITVISKLAKNATEANKHNRILPVAGDNYWPMSALVYSLGLPKKGGAEWKEGGKEHSIFMNMKDGGEHEKMFTTWFNLGKNIPQDSKSVWDRFSQGGQAFTIEGTWAQKSFSSTLKSDGKTPAIENPYNNLFSFPLPKINGHQMRHYLQGWNFGINSRNQVDGPKYKATADLLAELFSTDVQEIFYSERENYIPGNIKSGDLSKLQKSLQWNTSPLGLVNNNKEIYTVSRGDIPKTYYEIEFDKKLESITKPLKPNASGVVDVNDYDAWANSTMKYLQDFGFVK